MESNSEYVSRLLSSHCVYLMQRDAHYRVGCAKLVQIRDSDQAFILGIRSRMHHEQAFEAWIIANFASRKEALSYELMSQVEFGIPSLSFIEQDMWLRIGNNQERAVDCLEYHNLSILQPHFPTKTRNTIALLQTIPATMRGGIQELAPPPDQRAPTRKLVRWERPPARRERLRISTLLTKKGVAHHITLDGHIRLGTPEPTPAMNPNDETQQSCE